MKHSLRHLAAWSPAQARIGLLEPISARDSLALAWAKAAVMSELGASSNALQGEISRLMEPHAWGRGDLARCEFGDPDKISLQALARLLSGRQARQLAADVGLAAQAVAREHGGGLKSRVIGAIGALGPGQWFDPLGGDARESGDMRARGGAGQAAASRGSVFACARLRFQRLRPPAA